MGKLAEEIKRQITKQHAVAALFKPFVDICNEARDVDAEWMLSREEAKGCLSVKLSRKDRVQSIFVVLAPCTNDAKQVSATIVVGKYLNSGIQSKQRFFAPHNEVSEFTEKLAAAMLQVIAGQ
jgi:hypothetical protein